MGTWSTVSVDKERAAYGFAVVIDGITTCSLDIRLRSNDANNTIPEADAEAALDAALATLGTNLDFTVSSASRSYETVESYTP